MRAISIFLVGVLVMSANTFSAAARAETVLHFPDDQSIGTPKTRAVRPKYDTRWEANWSGWANTVEARGAVTLPAGHEAMLTINRDTPAGLACLDAIPPDALANLHLHQCKLGDEDLEHFARVATLRMLSIFSCEFDHASLAKLVRLSKLRGIWFMARRTATWWPRSRPPCPPSKILASTSPGCSMKAWLTSRKSRPCGAWNELSKLASAELAGIK